MQYYDWGSSTSLASLQGRPVPSPHCEAELWFGAHPDGPAKVHTDGRRVPLAEWIEADPEGRLGAAVVARFGAELPFLLKLLAVARPLSLQVHPDSEKAQEGFARERRGSGVPDQERRYRDARHKPELVCALSPFHALQGFRPWPEIQERLRGAGVYGGLPGLEALAERPAPETGRALLESLLTVEPRAGSALVRGAAAWAQGSEDPSLAWLVRLAEAYPDDPAALAPLFLDFVELQPGQGLYLPPGELHCYLEGFAIELMASSDNVVRAGLTSKPVDVPELLRLTRFAPRPAQPLDAEPTSAAEAVFAPPVSEFRLSLIRTGAASAHRVPASGSLEILLCVEGRACVGADGSELRAGTAAVVPADAGAYSVRGEAVLYRAWVPSPD